MYKLTLEIYVCSLKFSDPGNCTKRHEAVALFFRATSVAPFFSLTMLFTVMVNYSPLISALPSNDKNEITFWNLSNTHLFFSRPGEFMDAETNTNPIDRSIAHLLFHKPLAAATRSAADTRSLESHIMVSLLLTVSQLSLCSLLFSSLNSTISD